MALSLPLRLWHPEWFQGSLHRKRYFEGWYFKQVTEDAADAWSFIPGVSLSPSGRKAFVQVISGNDAQTWFVEYPIEEFHATRYPFSVSVGPNRFGTDGFELDLPTDDGRFRGSVQFLGITPFPATFVRPGIMGPYSFVPFMECYHGIVSLNHRVEGHIETPKGSVTFEGGRGYIEKDWGGSMPSSWVWMQTNHLSNPGDTMMLSVARIPWLGGHFTGFLFIGILDGEFILRTTYTGTRLEQVTMTDTEAHITMRTGTETLHVTGRRNRSGLLLAPVHGAMDRRIPESIDAVVSVTLRDEAAGKHKVAIGSRAGMEMVGNREELVMGG